MRGPLLVVTLCACTRDNPLFGAGGTEGNDTAEATAEATGDATTITGPGDGTAETSTLGETSVTHGDSASDGGGETLGDSSSASAGDSGDACTLPEFGQLVIEPGDVLPDVDPACMGLWMPPQGLISTDGAKITVATCQCPCGAAPVGEATVTVTGVEIPPLPECGRVVVWAKPVDRGCVWGGVAVFRELEPTWIASKALFVPPSMFGGITLHRTLQTPCEAGPCNDAGTDALVFDGVVGDNAITMEQAPKIMSLPFFAPSDYLVDNVSAGVDEACVDHLAWTATHVQ